MSSQSFIHSQSYLHVPFPTPQCQTHPFKPNRILTQLHPNSSQFIPLQNSDTLILIWVEGLFCPSPLMFWIPWAENVATSLKWCPGIHPHPVQPLGDPAELCCICPLPAPLAPCLTMWKGPLGWEPQGKASRNPKICQSPHSDLLPAHCSLFQTPQEEGPVLQPKKALGTKYR